MSTQVRILLADLAEDARDYADPDKAISVTRRRRTIRTIVAPVAAALAVAVAVLGPLALAPDRRVAKPAPDGSTSVVAGYPARVAPPGQITPLPASAGVGAAAFVYAPCIRDCDPFLVLPDGRQYRLDRPIIGPPLAGYTLSPDGVWLGSITTTGFELRNLVTGQGVPVPDDGPGVTAAWAWAPNSQKVLLARHASGLVDHYLLVDLTGHGLPAIHKLSVRAVGDWVVALRNGGDVLRWLSGGATAGSLPKLALTNPDTGASTEFTVALPAPGLLTAGETFQDLTVYIGPSNDLSTLVVNAPAVADAARPAGFLDMLLSDKGRVVSRIDVPRSAVAYGSEDGVWEVRANLVGGIILVHSAPDRTEIVLCNDVTGVRTVVTTLPAESQVMPRSSARY